MATALIVVLSVLGAAALIGRAVRAGGRMLLAFAESTAAQGMADASARRGDVTGLRDRQEIVARARRRRGIESIWFFFWLGLLVVPIVAGLVPLVYPAAAVLWLLPRRRAPASLIRPPVP